MYSFLFARNFLFVVFLLAEKVGQGLFIALVTW